MSAQHTPGYMARTSDEIESEQMVTNLHRALMHVELALQSAQQIGAGDQIVALMRDAEKQIKHVMGELE